MNKELKEAKQNLIQQLENIKIANECGLATKGEFNKDIKALEIVLNHIENSIPKEKVEEKIEELENEQSKVKNNKLIYSREDVFRFQIYILEELLEGK